MIVSAAILEIIRVTKPLKDLAKFMLKENCPFSWDRRVSILFRFRRLPLEKYVLSRWFSRIGTERFILLYVNKSV